MSEDEMIKIRRKLDKTADLAIDNGKAISKLMENNVYLIKEMIWMKVEMIIMEIIAFILLIVLLLN
ncbi:hypothetical protein [Leuconostoc lactis]|uniref:hypothetical protein n=1 Tax=Leuconostoc lactis TaxID=1246 RepID=UPI0006DD34FA|nr:hypothetical protein [Leuconostoc lactis]KQB80963.1 hypothetical protein AN225_05530 [Leuconostoc lactis]